MDGTAATDAVDDEDDEDWDPSNPVAEIVAAMELVLCGLAVSVSLVGFQFPPDLIREAMQVADQAGCRAIPLIGNEGRLALIVTAREADRG